MIDKFFIFFLSFIILPDLFIFKMVILQITQKKKAFLYFIPSLILMLGIALLRFGNDKFIIDNGVYVSWFVFICILFTLPKMLFFVCSILDFVLKFFVRLPISGFDILSLVLPIVSVVVLLYGAIAGKTKFTIKEVVYSSASLPPAFDGYRILQLSDFHIGSWKGNPKIVRQIIETANDQKTDLIVFTGDLINADTREIEEFKEILLGLRARDGIYSILGNHDYGYYYPYEGPWEREAAFEALKVQEAWMGWQLLNNEHTHLYRENDSIALIGVENWGKPPFEGKGDLKKAVQGLNTEFKILLTHNPDHWEAVVLPTSDINLTLAGHTHASQLQFGKYSPSSWHYKEWGGLYTKENQSIYVNVGIGHVGIPFRFGAWPEMTVITLKRE